MFQDVRNLHVRSLSAHTITRTGPVLQPGTVYAVKYHEMFTWTRQSHTPAAYGPTADCTDLSKMQDWHYTCQPALSKTAKMASGSNYMFVVGPINHAPSCLLLFFFNSCHTLDQPYQSCTPTGADGAVAQGIYMPAIYDRDTGTIFSETFKAPLNSLSGNINELGWHIYGKAQTVSENECCTRLTMTRAQVTARMLDTAQAEQLQTQLLAGILHRFRQKEGRFVKWVAGNYPVPPSDPFVMSTVFTDESRTPPDSTLGGTACSTVGYVSSNYATPAPYKPCTATCPDATIGTLSEDCGDDFTFFPHGSTSL